MAMQPFWSPVTARVGQSLPLPTRTASRCARVAQSGTWFQPVQWSGAPAIGHATADLLRAVIDNSVQEDDTSRSAPESAAKKARSSKKNTVVPPGRATKIRIYPTAKQRAVLQEWFGAARWTYNQCVDAVEIKKSVTRDKKALRAYCTKQDAPQVTANPWVLKTPQAIRDEALLDLLKAYKTAFTLRKTKQQTTPFVMKFRSLKAPSQSIVIHHRDWKDTTKIFLSAAFKKRGAETTLQTSEPLPATIDYDCRLQRTRLGHYYFCLLQPVRRSENQAPPPDPLAAPRILAIDPGVRTFLTGYNPHDGSYVEWGKGDMRRIERLASHLDDLIGRTTKEHAVRRRYVMRKAQLRMRLRIRNLVDEFHKKLVRWLVTSYELVLLPEYESSKMVNKTTRKIARPSVRAMITWAPYRFKQRLLMKAKMEGSRCHVRIVDEHHTTMTCGACGYLNRAVGASKCFSCPACLTTLSRDWNAARNIFLRYLTTSTWATSLPGLGLGPARS